MFLLVLAHPGGPGKRTIKWLCVCVCVCVWVHTYIHTYTQTQTLDNAHSTHTCLMALFRDYPGELVPET